jgi:hypothetical protein
MQGMEDIIEEKDIKKEKVIKNKSICKSLDGFLDKNRSTTFLIGCKKLFGRSIETFIQSKYRIGF